MLSDLRQLCVHHPCGFTSCKVGLWFLPAWRRYHFILGTNYYTPRYVHPIRARTLTAISLPSSTFLAAILICPVRLLAARPPFPIPSCSGRFNTRLGHPTALLQSFVFRHLRTLSVFVYHLTLASLSFAHLREKHRGVASTGRRPPATLPLSPLFPVDTQEQEIMGSIDRVTFSFTSISRRADIFYRGPISLGAGHRALAFHESQLSNYRSCSLSARRQARCHKAAEVGV
jgi:hypothetical protein